MNEVVGELRKGQLITTFGVGSFVDLPHLSVVVQGLQLWPVGACQEILEPRLVRAVRSKLPTVHKVRGCPDASSDAPEFLKRDLSGIPTRVFPRWLRCPLCNALGTVDTGAFAPAFPPYQIDRIRFLHRGCPEMRTRGYTEKTMPGAVPARFLIACSKGHVADFPWIEFCHRGVPCGCGAPSLVLTDEGVTGEAAEVQVRCVAKDAKGNPCGAWRPLADAFGPKAELGIDGCPGLHPHLGEASNCNCVPVYGSPDKLEAILLGASHLYFPVNVSVLALPTTSVVTDLDSIVREHWDRCESVTSEADASALIKFGGLSDFLGIEASDLWAAIRAQMNPTELEPGKVSEIKREEYAVFSGSGVPITTPRLSMGLAEVPKRFSNYVDRVGLVTNLTEFSAMVGFTRIDSAGDLSDYDSIDPDRLAPMTAGSPSWVPGAENRGEGLFVQLRESLVKEWEARKSVRAKLNAHRIALDAFKKERPWMEIDLPPSRFFLLHALSHFLLRELAIVCGYAGTSIRERIYSSAEGGQEMAGILIYTASPDSEGTLGGLVSQGRSASFETLLSSALERARLCTTDPLCSAYNPAQGSKLHGAACHACSFVSEVSCERSNRFLDREFVVPTLAGSEAAFFGEVMIG